MPYLNHEISEAKQIVGLPVSIEMLDQSCRDMQLLDENTVYLPGLSMLKCETPEMVNGVYGIGQLDSHEKKVVAVTGFDVIDNNLVILQTPQPLKPKDLRILGANVLPRLRSRDFRGQMIDQVIAIGKSLGVDRILAVPAARYANVEGGITDYDYVYDRVDAVLKRNGFSLNGQYYEYQQ
jgi:hypothetical protein